MSPAALEPAPSRAAGPVVVPRRSRSVASPAAGLVVALVLLQRLALPLGAGTAVPVLLLVLVGATAAGLLTGRLGVARTRLQLFCLAVAGCAAAAVVDLARGEQWSATSFAYLVALYLPFVTVVRHGSDEAFEHVLRLFCRVMTVFAVVAIVHFTLQAAGWTYRDLLADVVPQRFLLQGFNTANPIVFGSPIYRENAVVFLEPSFFSQYLALAVLARLRIGRPRGTWVYLLALLTTVSGTGWLALGVGLAVMAFSRGSRQIVRFGIPLLLVTVTLLLSPLGGVFRSRLNDQFGPGSSAQERFVAPYTLLLDSWHEDVPTIVAGHGPGAGDRLANAVSQRLIAPVLPKMLVEYGVLGAVGFLLFVGVSLCRGTRAPPLTAGLAAAYFVLNASTLVPAMVGLVVVLHVWFAPDEAPR